MECAIDVADWAIAPPDSNLVGKQYIMPDRFLNKIVNLF